MQASSTTAPESAIRHTFPSTLFPPDDLSSDLNVAPGEEAGMVEIADAGTGRRTPFFDRFDLWFGGGRDLEPVLGRRHIFMISIGGTIGMGLVLTSGEVLRLSGSTGVIVAYALMGAVVAAVMSSIAEMVSLIPEAGAITLFPSRFGDGSLGFAVGVGYWFTNCMAVVSLTTATAILSNWWTRDVIDLAIGWRIFLFLFVLIIINILGAKVYGEIEHFFGWLKIIAIVGLAVFMLAISCGANNDHKYYGVQYWKGNYTMPPIYEDHPNLRGGPANFLSVWTSFVKAAFAYIGVEIVAVCAGEAKYPRKDVPFVAKSVFLVTVAIYIFSVMFMTLVVPWTEPNLLKITDNTDKFTGSRSPFIIAIKNAGYQVLPGLVNAAFLFMAWTAANTALYVASRTLHGMCYGLEKNRSQFFWPLGRTRRQNGAPVMAILASCIPAPLAWLVCSTQEPKVILNIFTRMGTVSALMVWGCQCFAFLRFYFGLTYSMHDRSSSTYPYRSKFQPATAIFGLVSCSLLVIFNGWDTFIGKPIKAADVIAAYLWPIAFALIYALHKLKYKTEAMPLRDLDYGSLRADNDREPDPSKHGRLRKLLEMRRPTPRLSRDPMLGAGRA